MKKFSPAFIGIGASYAGLSEITAWLSAHPQISDHVPATHYFATRAYATKDVDWYRSTILDHQKPDQLVGECSASYLHHAEAPARIATDCPDTKLIVVLRHPIRRMLAEYEALTSIDAKARTMTPAAYLAAHQSLQAESLYSQALSRYFAYYSPLQLYVILYEDLIESPLTTMQALYEFLEINKNFVPAALQQFAPPPDEPKHPSLLYRGKRQVRRLYKRLFSRPTARVFAPVDSLDTLLSPAEWELFARPFATDAQNLSVLLNRDMSGYWKFTTDEEISST